MRNAIPDRGHLARPGAEISLRAYTTAAPENGKANAAIANLLARALGLPKSRLTLIHGAAARTKIFRIDCADLLLFPNTSGSARGSAPRTGRRAHARRIPCFKNLPNAYKTPTHHNGPKT